MKKERGSRLNPYIATTDVMVSVILVFVLMLAVVSAAGGAGDSAGQRQRDLLALRVSTLTDAVNEIPRRLRPELDHTRNDPEGVRRWRFSLGSEFFDPATMQLSPAGHQAVEAFGSVLKNTPVWRRVRVEGHAPQTLADEPEDWEGSVLRAVRVADILTEVSDLDAWCIAIAGRGGQDPVARGVRTPGVNDRVDIVVEFPINDEPCLQEAAVE